MSELGEPLERSVPMCYFADGGMEMQQGEVKISATFLLHFFPAALGG